MIKKIFDYYYIVLLRHYDNWYKKDRLSYRVSAIIAPTLTVNLASLAILLDRHIFEKTFFWFNFVIVGILIMNVLDIIYNKKRRESLREEYKHESRESRQRGVIKVVLYEILSLAFLIWMLSMIERPHPR